MDYKGEVRHVPEEGGGNFGKYLEGGTVSLDREGDTTKSGYFTFEPEDISTIKWMPTAVQVSEFRRYPRG